MALALIDTKEDLTTTLLGLNNEVTHYNILRYRTLSGPVDDYHTLPDYIDTEIIAKDRIGDVISKNSKSKNAIGISSICRTQDGRFYHMKQLDIDAGFKNSNNFFEGVSKLIQGTGYRKSIGISGYLFNSGSGFHYYEQGLLTEEEWKSWINNAKTITEFVDPKWADLSLKRGFSTLRINSTDEKPVVPFPICRVCVGMF